MIQSFELLASSSAESWGQVAAVIYLVICLILISICNFVFQPTQKKNLKKRERTLVRTGLVLIAAQIILTVMGLAFFAQGLIEKNIRDGAVFYWILTVSALVVLITFWGYRRADKQFTEDHQKGVTSYGLIIGVLCGVCLMVFSIGLPELWPVEVRTTENLDQFSVNIYSLLILAMTALMAPLVEEIIFRLGLQSIFEMICKRFKFNPIHAIGLTSLLFAMVHGGNVEPFGFKETQIFIVGMTLGFLKFRFGFWSCVAAHLTLNSLIISAELIFRFMTG